MRRSLRSAVVTLGAVALWLSACDAGKSPDVTPEPLVRAKPGPAAPAAPADVERQAPARSAAPSDANPPPGEDAARDREAEPRAPAPRAVRAMPDREAPRAHARSMLTVKRLVVTQALEGREPVEGEALRAGTAPLVAFVELASASDQPESIEIGFESAGGPSVGNVRLEVPPKTRRYRTWGRTRRVRSPGDWVAVVRSAAGEELARRAFHLDP